MKTILRGVAALLVIASAASYALDHNPLSAGTTQMRNGMGRTYEAGWHNPAILGVERSPRGGLLLFPVTDVGVGLWSDKLAISPFSLINILSNTKDSAALALEYSRILANSFNIPGQKAGQTDSAYAEDVSARLTKGFKDGFSIYAGAKTTLLSITQTRFSFDISTHFDEQIRLPEGLLYSIFSSTDGIQRGNTLDFTDFRQQGLWATDFTLSLGLPVQIPALHNFFKLRYGAGGVGVKYVMGHSILNATMDKGSFEYKQNENVYALDAEMRVQTAGVGLSGPMNINDKLMFANGFPLNGHGLGADIGGILYDDKGTLSLNFENLGAIFWINDIQEATYKIKKDDLTVYEIINGIRTTKRIENGDTSKVVKGDESSLTIFNRNAGEYLSTSDDTLKESNGFVTLLPMTFNFGYARSWDLKHLKKRALIEHAVASANYQQALVRGPGRSFIPRVSIGGEIGTLYGYLPLRAGYIFGGPEKIATAGGFSFNYKKYFTISGSLKSLGWVPMSFKRGFEAAGGLGVNWGMGIDSDKDGIIDSKDKCPHDPEDVDAWEDEDGCPDFDNDKDGIPDISDKCPMVAEDMDNFEDADGCPEIDNDVDGVPDTTDKCPNVPEDKDNFQDADGCPDFDNDADGVPDSTDKCPIMPEDIDLFEDADGCPEFDNDKDGIADSTDRCPMVPEVYNGYQDEDGCPDTLAKPSEKEIQVLTTKLRDINFKTASAELLPVSFASLDYIVGFLKQYQNLKYEIQGHTDDQGSDDYNLLLSAARAGTVRAYLLSKGIADSALIAIGYGETRSIADNKKASGRAINRRVEFKFIETVQEYSTLKVQEAMFREKIKAAKIKGSDY